MKKIFSVFVISNDKKGSMLLFNYNTLYNDKTIMLCQIQ